MRRGVARIVVGGLFLFSVFCTPASSSDLTLALILKAQALKLWTDPVWLRLLHYKGSRAGSLESYADGQDFFNSPRGKVDAEAELVATLRALFDVTPRKFGRTDQSMPPPCMFPARKKWLESRLGFTDAQLPPVQCTDYDAFRKRVSPKSIAVVFSAYYMGSSSSVFGHTFLRIKKQGNESQAEPEGNELLDYGINFGAESTTSNAVLYAILGIVGGFRGTFSNVPYYYKIREYNDYESRDLWTYELNLTPEQVDRVVDHLWELGFTYFDYFFFTENCSFHILAALEVAVPDARLTERLPYWVIPSDTVSVLNHTSGLVQSVKYRPSIRSQLVERIQKLSTAEEDVLKQVVLKRDSRSIGVLADRTQMARVMDAALDYVDFKYPENQIPEKADPQVASWRQSLLIQRASLGVRSQILRIEPADSLRPDRGHGSARFSLGGGWDHRDHGFGRLEMRFALHDLLDPSGGYPEHSQIEFMNLRARYAPSLGGHFRPEEVGLIKTRSNNPRRWYDSGGATSLAFGLYEIRDRNCANCLAARLDGGLGWTVGLSGSSVASLLIEAEGSYSPSFYESHGRLGVGPRLGWYLDPGAGLRMSVEGFYRALAFAKSNRTFGSEFSVAFSRSRKQEWVYRRVPLLTGLQNCPELRGSTFRCKRS